MSAAVRSNFERYLSSSTNTYFKKGDDWLGIFDDGVFKLGQHSAGLGEQIATLTGNTEAAKKYNQIVNGFLTARDAIGAVRFVPAFHKLCTGQSFWQTDSAGWRRVTHQDGKPVYITKAELNVNWKKQDGVWVSIPDPSETSLDGKYIDNPAGEYITRDWMDIAIDILICIARFLSPIRWLHSLKAIDLGKHAQWTGGVVMGIWGTVVTMCFVQSMHDLINEVDLQKIQRRIWEAFQGFIDLIAIPFDFGVGSAHPALAIVGAGFNIISAGSLLAKNAVYYG